MKVLVTGKDGQVGWELQRALAAVGDVVALGRQELDLRNVDAIRRTVRDLLPNIVINAAGYTDVNRAEAERAIADEVNGRAPGIFAEEAARIGALLVHYSTDYVFSGDFKRPYREDDPVGPINAYGASKLLGEQAIQAVGGHYLIFRTAWVYATRGKNFFLTILRFAREGKPLRVVADQKGTPTWARLIAETTAAVLRKPAGELAQRAGVYHLTAGGETNWHEFARAILSEVANSHAPDAAACRQALERLQAITSAEFSTPARRPANSVLDNQKLVQVFGIRFPGWREQLHLAVEDWQRGETTD
ncbi:MAG TPA: dTDP-4-dehydrorhamnose reductase [Terriglobales bacterium]|nr:dTDP-4-dehydrorhamnose reductase [Terriglobales bacterium]